MADSIITKQALAASLKDLMREVPFEKINVAQICERCGMNRKSFYYHFRDKFDLVNWIFDTEFIALATQDSASESAVVRWAFVEQVCQYFYNNRHFYRKAFQITGQNSFSEHFTEYIGLTLRDRLSHILGDDPADTFAIDFYTDAILCAIKRWLLDKHCMPPEEFVSRIKRLVESGARIIYQGLESEKEGRDSPPQSSPQTP